MAFTPKSINLVRSYLVDKTGREGKYFSVSRTVQASQGQRKFRGYHLGRDQIFGPNGLGDRDYSVRRRRDRVGLTDARSALDINLSDKVEKDLIVFLRSAVLTGLPGAEDVREFLGPLANGRAARFAIENEWEPELYPVGDSHEWHVHVSWFRDSEMHDKVMLFEPFFGGRAALPPEEVPDPEVPDVEVIPPPDPEIARLTAELATAVELAQRLGGELATQAEQLLAVKPFVAEVVALGPTALAIQNKLGSS